MAWEKADFFSPWRTAFMMPNIGEFRRDEKGLHWLPTSTDLLPQPFFLVVNTGEQSMEPMPTKLSDVLEEKADSKYYLSAKACSGILNRAAKRGKELPDVLKMALENQIERSNDVDINTL